jgi:methylenetetrahydrofolate dehydrogenase (NADP+)/methenyltetrahydrofolate cyclohydrolase/formyltetrahydrofolate synthetase
LEKLGISKTDPDSLTPEEQRTFARLNIDVNSITWKRGESCFYFVIYLVTFSEVHRSNSNCYDDELGKM